MEVAPVAGDALQVCPGVHGKANRKAGERAGTKGLEGAAVRRGCCPDAPALIHKLQISYRTTKKATRFRMTISRKLLKINGAERGT